MSADPRELALRINLHLGHRPINAMGVAALTNLVTLARNTARQPAAFDQD